MRREELRTRVQDLLPGTDPDSATGQAAAILIAAVEVGQNIDRLARLTGYPREVVARCARRLWDSGVWQGGETACTRSAPPERTDHFLDDLAIAEGRLSRSRAEGRGLDAGPRGPWRAWHPMDGEEPIATALDHDLAAGSLPYGAWTRGGPGPEESFAGDAGSSPGRARSEEPGSRPWRGAIGEAEGAGGDARLGAPPDGPGPRGEAPPSAEGEPRGRAPPQLFPGAVWLG